MLIKSISIITGSFLLLGLSYADNDIIKTKLQTKGMLGGCLSASFIDKSGKEGPLRIISSEKPINVLFKYYCVTGKVIGLPKNLPCSDYAKTVFKITSQKEINSDSESCDKFFLNNTQ